MDALPKLNNIIHSIEIDTDDKLLNEVRECIFILIDEFIENNIELYKYQDFEDLVSENVYDYFLELYPYDLLNIELIKSSTNKVEINGEFPSQAVVKNKNGELKIRMGLEKRFRVSKTTVKLYYKKISI